MTEHFITNLKEMMKLAKRINDEDESLRIVDVPDEDTKVIGGLMKIPNRKNENKKYTSSEVQALSLAASFADITKKEK